MTVKQTQIETQMVEQGWTSISNAAEFCTMFEYKNA